MGPISTRCSRRLEHAGKVRKDGRGWYPPRVDRQPHGAGPLVPAVVARAAVEGWQCRACRWEQHQVESDRPAPTVGAGIDTATAHRRANSPVRRSSENPPGCCGYFDLLSIWLSWRSTLDRSGCWDAGYAISCFASAWPPGSCSAGYGHFITSTSHHNIRALVYHTRGSGVVRAFGRCLSSDLSATVGAWVIPICVGALLGALVGVMLALTIRVGRRPRVG